MAKDDAARIKALETKVKELEKHLKAFEKAQNEFEKKQGEWAKKQLEAMEDRSVERHNQQTKDMQNIIAWAKKTFDTKGFF